MDGVILLAVKRVAYDVEVGHFLIRDDDALWIDVFIQFATRSSQSEKGRRLPDRAVYEVFEVL